MGDPWMTVFSVLFWAFCIFAIVASIIEPEDERYKKDPKEPKPTVEHTADFPLRRVRRKD